MLAVGWGGPGLEMLEIRLSELLEGDLGEDAGGKVGDPEGESRLEAPELPLGDAPVLGLE
jgi:hypothetical protein